MNFPTMLTMLRFVFIPVYIVVFASGHMKGSLVVVLLAGLTDILDGYLARRNGQVTHVGAMLDPLADKSMMITVVISLLVTGHLHWLACAAFFIRDIGMIIGAAVFHFRGKKTVPANWMGKLTTVLLYAAIVFIFFELPFAGAYLWGVIAFSFVTSIIYVILFARLNRQSGPQSPVNKPGGTAGTPL